MKNGYPHDRTVFYQNLTDLIYIFWNLHKIRLDNNEIPFALDRRKTLGRDDPYVEFNIRRSITENNRKYGIERHPVLVYYANGVRASLVESWWEYIGPYDNPHPGFTWQDTLPERYNVFTKSQFVKKRIENIGRMGPELSRDGIKDNYTISNAIERGFGGAIPPMVQLAALACANNWIDPKSGSLMLSKTDIDYIENVRASIGMRHGEMISNFDLFNPEARKGLDRDTLRNYGYGNALGCPAGNRPTKECREFLEEQCHIDVGSNTVIGELSDMVVTGFERYVGNWFKTFTRRERKRLIDSNDLAILEGMHPSAYPSKGYTGVRYNTKLEDLKKKPSFFRKFARIFR